MEPIQILGIIVLAIGIILIGVEFYIPGFGYPGIFGIICTAAGVFLAGKDMSERVTVGIIAIVIIAVMLVISIIVFNSKKVKSPIKLETDLQGKNLFLEENDMEYLVGKKGKSISDLKPAGKGEFDGVKLDILSSGYYIKKDTALVITGIKDNRIIVEEDK
ncbi:MAG: hypothetical protein J5712_02960 [Lachnospiraceae bacterium]|nr:hypothetical protein [Lachnospiraceae bacterium]